MALTAKKVYAILKRQISDMEAKLNSPVRYRGTVATADLLPLNPDIGDMYNIESKSVYGEAGMNVAWNGVVWDTMGAPIDMSLYFTKEEAEAVIQRLVTEYFEKNPVKPGATTEQAQQIEQNKTDIASLKTETGSLKEDMSNKITKFYASSQGEPHLADSDNGKIMDMMVYGKSEQKQYSGKNLLNATLQTTTQNGVTCTANRDGTYTLNGTATSDTQLVVGYHNILDGQVKMLGCPSGGSTKTYCVIMQFSSNITGGEKGRIYDIGNGGVGSTSNSIESGANYIRGIIFIISGTTCNNLLFKPMLTTDLTATYDDFEPYTGGIPSPNPDYPQEIKSVVNPTVKLSNEDGTQFKTVTLPYTLNAIPVSSGGNVTIDGQQYIADYVDVERGKLVRMVGEFVQNNQEWRIEKIDLPYVVFSTKTAINNMQRNDDILNYCSNYFKCITTNNRYSENTLFINSGYILVITMPSGTTVDDFLALIKGKLKVFYTLATPIEIDLTPEEVQAFKALTTYYPTTNISVNSEQLDGYTVFNYPISMQNGWNYVKQQIGDTREYIYDMDARTQDTDLQSAEAYVNSEYAVALTELEV